MRTDAEVVRAVADGDRGALRELFDRHAGWLTARLTRRCADAGVVDEVVQDTFLRAWRKAGTYRGEGDVAAWLWRIALRRLIDRSRQRVPTPTAVLVERDDHAISVEDEVLVALQGADLSAAIARLSPELRAALQATVLDGLTTREASRLLGVPAGTVKSRVRRARIRLREELS